MNYYFRLVCTSVICDTINITVWTPISDIKNETIFLYLTLKAQLESSTFGCKAYSVGPTPLTSSSKISGGVYNGQTTRVCQVGYKRKLHFMRERPPCSLSVILALTGRHLFPGVRKTRNSGNDDINNLHVAWLFYYIKSGYWVITLRLCKWYISSWIWKK